MGRLIDADAVCKECIDELILETCEGCVIKDHKLHRAVDAVPVVHGRWVYLGDDEWLCPKCGEIISTEGSWEKPFYNYCYECGAKMDLEVDGDEP